MNRPHRYIYKFSDNSELEKIEREYFSNAHHRIYWMYRTAIFHYSNGTNRCCIEGCDAPLDSLTLEHENFDKKELANRLGLKSATGANHLATALINASFPDVNITVKCMMHNLANKHPEQSIRIAKSRISDRSHIDPLYVKKCIMCKEETKSISFSLNNASKDGLSSYCMLCNRIQTARNDLLHIMKAYALYGYTGDPKGMSFEHSNCDGHLHRKYLQEKYNLKSYRSITGSAFARYLLREHKAGIPNYPGLIIVKQNVQQASARDCAKLRRINND